MKLLLILCALAAAAFGRDRIWDIEFYGYKGIDVAVVRKALPVHNGDPASSAAKRAVQQAVQRTIGRPATQVSFGCCDEHGDSVLFIGLPGESSKSFVYNPDPRGSIRLSAEIVALSEKLDDAIEAAVHEGGNAATEDDSNGYALIQYPAARALQLEIRRYALQHEEELFHVLAESSHAEQRGIAAGALGYARQSPEQIAALVQASRDSDGLVRNNATRALGVMAGSRPELAKQIPPGAFIEMMNSGLWTDRNKASSVLSSLTVTREPDLLAQIKAGALDSLIEMAKWRDNGHAFFGRTVLGRIAGVPENRLDDLPFILDALGKK